MLEWVVIAAYSLIGLALLLLAILSLNLSIIVGLHLFHRRRARDQPVDDVTLAERWNCFLPR